MKLREALEKADMEVGIAVARLADRSDKDINKWECADDACKERDGLAGKYLRQFLNLMDTTEEYESTDQCVKEWAGNTEMAVKHDQARSAVCAALVALNLEVKT